MNRVVLGSVAIVAAALLWSLDGLLRFQLYSLPAPVIVFWEHLFGLLVLAAIVVFNLDEFRRLSRRQWGAIALVALLSGALGTIFYTAALAKVGYIQFSVVVLLQQLQPLFAIITAALLLKEPITKKFFGLAILALGAAYLVSFPTLTVSWVESAATMIAAVLAVGAAVSWGASTAFSKYSLQGTSFLHVTAGRFALTPVFALLIVALRGQTGQLWQINSLQWRYIILITFSTGLVALAIYYFGLQRVPASRSTILELAWPLSAVLTGYFFFQERLTLTQWLGSLVLIVVMWLVARDARAVVKST